MCSNVPLKTILRHILIRNKKVPKRRSSIKAKTKSFERKQFPRLFLFPQFARELWRTKQGVMKEISVVQLLSDPIWVPTLLLLFLFPSPISFSSSSFSFSDAKPSLIFLFRYFNFSFFICSMLTIFLVCQPYFWCVDHISGISTIFLVC